MNNLTERGKIQKRTTGRKYQTELYGPRHKYSNREQFCFRHQQNKFRYDLFIRSVYPYEQFRISSFYYNS